MNNPTERISKGTTIVAAIYDSGVMLAADSRTTTVCFSRAH